ncbi:MAG TPA: recombinase family protein [Acidimicrobiales bacterium]|nr:recombinase family protein [Acidimicrobiales bacterium]
MRNTRSARTQEASPRRAAIYARISKDEERDELGVARQEKLCRQLAARLGWEVVGVYRDDNLSAYKRGRRPEYDRLVADIEVGHVDAILVYNPDRLSRDDLRGLEDLIDLLNGFGVDVETVRAGHFDLSTAHGRAQARMAGVWARLESEKASERLRDKHAELVEAGLPNGGPPPYGYRRVGDKTRGEDTRALVPHPDEAPVVVEVMGRLAAGETLTGIADDLNSRGITTTAGHRWTPGNIRRMGLNGAYAGVRFHRGVEVGKASWPALVDEQTWRRARALRTDPSRTGRRSARRWLLVGGLSVCGTCGTALRSKPHRGGRTATVGTYSCPVRRDGGCGGVTVLAEPVEDLVKLKVIETVESPAFAKRLRARATGDRQAAAAAERLVAEKAELLAAYEAGSIDVAEWVRAKAAVERRLGEAHARMSVDQADAAVGRFAGRTGALATAWPDLSLDQRQAIVRAALAEPVKVMSVGRGTGNRFNRDRVKISVR